MRGPWPCHGSAASGLLSRGAAGWLLSSFFLRGGWGLGLGTWNFGGCDFFSSSFLVVVLVVLAWPESGVTGDQKKDREHFKTGAGIQHPLWKKRRTLWHLGWPVGRLVLRGRGFKACCRERGNHPEGRWEASICLRRFVISPVGFKRNLSLLFLFSPVESEFETFGCRNTHA